MRKRILIAVGFLPLTAGGADARAASYQPQGNWTMQGTVSAPAATFMSIGLDPTATLRNLAAAQTCNALATLTVNGSGGICQNWAGTTSSTDVPATAAAAATVKSTTIALTGSPGAVGGDLVFDRDNNGRGSLEGVVSAVNGSSVTLTAAAAYPIASGDRIVFEAPGTIVYAQSTASAAAATGATSVTVAAAPPAAMSGNGNIYAVDLDAANIGGTNSFGLLGAGVGQASSIKSNVLTLASPLPFPVASGDRIAIVSGTGAGNGGTGVAEGIINQTASGYDVVYGARGVCAGYSVNCNIWDGDFIAQSERGAFNATLIGFEMQINNHSDDNAFNYGIGMFNNGEFRNGSGFDVGKGISAGSDPDAGWQAGFRTNDGANISLGDFIAGATGSQDAFWSLGGTPNVAFEVNSSPTIAAFDYTPVIGGNYVNEFRVAAADGTVSTTGGIVEAPSSLRPDWHGTVWGQVPAGTADLLTPAGALSSASSTKTSMIAGGINTNNALMTASVVCVASGHQFAVRLAADYNFFQTEQTSQTVTLSDTTSAATVATAAAYAAAASGTNAVTVQYGPTTPAIAPGETVTDGAGAVPAGTVVTGVSENGGTDIVVLLSKNLASATTTSDGFSFASPGAAALPAGLQFATGRDGATGQPTISLTNGSSVQYNCAADVTVQATY